MSGFPVRVTGRRFFSAASGEYVVVVRWRSAGAGLQGREIAGEAVAVIGPNVAGKTI
jgi:hypothetical protein